MFQETLKQNAFKLRAYEELDNIAVVANSIEFDCSICMSACNIGDGIVLRNCLHSFCKDCIASVVHHSTECEINCPYINQNNSGCEGIIEEREIRGILSEERFEAYIQRTHKLNLNKVPNAFACRTLNCRGYWMIESNDVNFKCSLCEIVNCLNCKVCSSSSTVLLNY